MSFTGEAAQFAKAEVGQMSVIIAFADLQVRR